MRMSICRVNSIVSPSRPFTGCLRLRRKASSVRPPETWYTHRCDLSVLATRGESRIPTDACRVRPYACAAPWAFLWDVQAYHSSKLDVLKLGQCHSLLHFNLSNVHGFVCRLALGERVFPADSQIWRHSFCSVPPYSDIKPDFVEPISPAPMILGVLERDRRRVGFVVIRRIGREVADCMVWRSGFMWISYGRDVDLRLSVDHTVYDKCT